MIKLLSFKLDNKVLTYDKIDVDPIGFQQSLVTSYRSQEFRRNFIQLNTDQYAQNTQQDTVEFFDYLNEILVDD